MPATYYPAKTPLRANSPLTMRLLPIKDPERSWRQIKAQWKKDAEGVGEDFATFGGISAFEALTAREEIGRAHV